MSCQISNVLTFLSLENKKELGVSPVPGTSLGPSWDPRGPPRYLQGTAHGSQRRPYLNKCTAPEALHRCITILSLQRTSPDSPVEQVIYDITIGCVGGTEYLIC